MSCCGKRSNYYYRPSNPSPQYDPRVPPNSGSLSNPSSSSPHCPKCSGPTRVLHTYSIGSEHYTTWVCTNPYCGRHIDVKG